MDKAKVSTESKAEQARQRRRLNLQTKKPLIPKPLNNITHKNLRKKIINKDSVQLTSLLTDENANPIHKFDGVECHSNENINRLVPGNYISKSLPKASQSQPQAVSNPNMPFYKTPSQNKVHAFNSDSPLASTSQSQSQTPSTPIMNHYQLPTASFRSKITPASQYKQQILSNANQPLFQTPTTSVKPSLRSVQKSMCQTHVQQNLISTMNNETFKKPMTTSVAYLHQPARNIKNNKRNQSSRPLADITKSILNQNTTKHCNNVITPKSTMPPATTTNLIDRFSTTIPATTTTSETRPRGTKRKSITTDAKYFDSNKIHRPDHFTTDQSSDSSSSDSEDNHSTTSDSDSELDEDMPEEVDSFLQG